MSARRRLPTRRGSIIATFEHEGRVAVMNALRPPPTRFVITLETKAAGAEAARAIRRLLKFARRVCGLRAVDAREHIITADAETSSNGSDSARAAHPITR